MRQRISRIPLTGTCLCALLVFTAPASSSAQMPGADTEPLDCVMEPRSVIELGSAEEGLISKITVDRGDIVKEGDVVARLDSELQAVQVELARLRAESDADIRSSQARLEFRSSELGRLDKLHRKKVVSTKAYDEAAIEKRLAEYSLKAARLDRRIAELELTQAKARLKRRTLRSPVDGVVVEVTMALGEYAYEQAPVMTIAEIDPLNVEVFVPVARYGTVNVGMPAEVRPDPPIGGVYRARATVVDRVFDTASGTFGVRLELPNEDYQLPAGLKCKVRFLTGQASLDPAPKSADIDFEDLSSTASDPEASETGVDSATDGTESSVIRPSVKP